MSRFKRFTQSLATGYVALGAIVLYTLASVPLALHFLSKAEFGLWALATQISGYLALIDLGMSNSVSRILIDHKDTPETGAYGSIVKTGALVLVVQGLLIAVGGSVVSLWLAGLFAVPVSYHREFQILLAGQCVALGLTFGGRVFTHMLQAHQRYDLCNYAGIANLAGNLAVTWVAFAAGLGLYSLLAGSVASHLVLNLVTLVAAARLKLFPPKTASGQVNRRTFAELFSFGRRLFLIILGQQLVNASQVMVISRTLGLNAAATWSIATKGFTVAQQVVNRPFDYSTAGFSEMMVRGERARLLIRVRHLVVLSVSLAVWAGLGVALCNPGFLVLWTSGRVEWAPSANWLMALLTVVNCITRCYIGFTTLTKDIRLTQVIYLFEGIAFVILSLLAAPWLGINGIILCAILTNVLFTGIYGVYRATDYFQLPGSRLVLSWLASPFLLLVIEAVAFGAFSFISRNWPPFPRLLGTAGFSVVVGLVLFWAIGLTPDLRAEGTAFLKGLRARMPPFLSRRLEE